MRWEWLGDHGVILRDLDAPAFRVAMLLNGAAEQQQIAGLVEAYASYETVGLEIEPERFLVKELEEILQSIPQQNDHKGRASFDSQPKTHHIPVCYDLAPDLETVAEFCKLESDEVIRLHTSHEYQCHALGFCPGFAYLGRLPNQISGIPRRSMPRSHVEPGFVGITGGQTAVYPLLRPGGWNLIGRTPLTLVDPDDDYFPIEAGDFVRFISIGHDEYLSLKGERL